jgi:uncharacterized membrane protein
LNADIARQETIVPAPARHISRGILAAFFIAGFVLHFKATDAMISITPAWVPYPRAVVWFTGVLELLGALGLLLPRTRWLAGASLALYVLAVWPANIHHAFAHIVVPPIPDSWWYHAPRLALQPVIAWWALFAGGVIDWPLRRR